MTLDDGTIAPPRPRRLSPGSPGRSPGPGSRTHQKTHRQAGSETGHQARGAGGEAGAEGGSERPRPRRGRRGSDPPVGPRPGDLPRPEAAQSERRGARLPPPRAERPGRGPPALPRDRPLRLRAGAGGRDRRPGRRGAQPLQGRAGVPEGPEGRRDDREGSAPDRRPPAHGARLRRRAARSTRLRGAGRDQQLLPHGARPRDAEACPVGAAAGRRTRPDPHGAARAAAQ